ncbi:MAG: hypothetical protein M3422_24825 [Actinomycetota bacterium]|nr:hypothetical protein [Actinomycetota bacterium]
MTEPGPQPDYALNPGTFEKGIDRYLEPVVRDLAAVSDSYSSAHVDVAAAHANETPGWFGGEGNGEIRSATSSFLNEAAWQLQQLAGDQAELLGSLREYEAFLRAHIKWARETDEKHAENFRAIHRELLEGPRW